MSSLPRCPRPPRARRAGGASRRVRGRGECGLWPGGGPWSSARRRGCPGCPPAASAPRLSRRPPARPPRRAQSRRGSRSAQRGPVPTGHGRSTRGWLPLRDRTDLDRAAHAGGGDPRRHLDRRVEVVGLDDAVAVERLLGLDERAVGGQRLARPRPAPWWRSRAAAAGCRGSGRASRSPPASRRRPAAARPRAGSGQSRALGPRLISIMYFIASSLSDGPLEDERGATKSTARNKKGPGR